MLEFATRHPASSRRLLLSCISCKRWLVGASCCRCTRSAGFHKIFEKWQKDLGDESVKASRPDVITAVEW